MQSVHISQLFASFLHAARISPAAFPGFATAFQHSNDLTAACVVSSALLFKAITACHPPLRSPPPPTTAETLLVCGAACSDTCALLWLCSFSLTTSQFSSFLPQFHNEAPRHPHQTSSISQPHHHFKRTGKLVDFFSIFFVFVPLVQLPFVTLEKHSIIIFTTAPQQVFSAAAHHPRSTLPLPHTLPQLHHSHYILPTTLHHHVPYHSCTIILLVPLHL